MTDLRVIRDWCTAEGHINAGPESVLVIGEHRVCADCVHQTLWPDGCGENELDRREVEKTKDMLLERIEELNRQVKALQGAAEFEGN